MPRREKPSGVSGSSAHAAQWRPPEDRPSDAGLRDERLGGLPAGADEVTRAGLLDADDPDAPPPPDPAAAARAALARARKAARDKGFRPGMKPTRRPRPASGQPARSGAGPDARDPALLGDQISRLLDEHGWQADVQVGSVLGRWALIVGPEISAHVQPISFDGSTLRVQADSTAWATQMRLLASLVLGRIEQEAGAGVVTELVVEGPAAPSWVKGRRRVAGRGPRDTYG